LHDEVVRLVVRWIAAAVVLLSAVACTPAPDEARPAAETAAPEAPPATLEEAMDRLDATLSPEKLAELATGDPVRFHHSLGTAIRNRWGLWRDDSPLGRWFVERGIEHPDDMSGIVLVSWQRRHNGEPIDLAGQIADVRAYWAERKREYEEGTGKELRAIDLVEYGDRGWAALHLERVPYAVELAQSIRARAHGEVQECYERMRPTTKPEMAERTRLRMEVDRERRVTSVSVIETRSWFTSGRERIALTARAGPRGRSRSR
jgi:hypothetical protein